MGKGSTSSVPKSQVYSLAINNHIGTEVVKNCWNIILKQIPENRKKKRMKPSQNFILQIKPRSKNIPCRHNKEKEVGGDS